MLIAASSYGWSCNAEPFYACNTLNCKASIALYTQQYCLLFSSDSQTVTAVSPRVPSICWFSIVSACCQTYCVEHPSCMQHHETHYNSVAPTVLFHLSQHWRGGIAVTFTALTICWLTTASPYCRCYSYGVEHPSCMQHPQNPYCHVPLAKLLHLSQPPHTELGNHIEEPEGWWPGKGQCST